MEVQIALGADIAMVFDECTEYPATRERAAIAGPDHALGPSQPRLFLCACARGSMVCRTWRTNPSLFGIVQGGMYEDLRRESAERLVELDLPGYAIGGLSVGEPREHTAQ